MYASTHIYVCDVCTSVCTCVYVRIYVYVCINLIRDASAAAFALVVVVVVVTVSTATARNSLRNHSKSSTVLRPSLVRFHLYHVISSQEKVSP
jgi:hypothetical protein